MTTIDAIEINSFRAVGATARLRFFASRQFVDESGTICVGGAIDSSDFFKEVVCSVSNNTASVPALLLPTTDRLPNAEGLRFTAVVYGGRRSNKHILLADFVVPSSLGANCTWEDLTRYNSSQSLSTASSHEFYDRDQTERAIERQIEERFGQGGGTVPGGLGTAALRNVPLTGNAAAGEVVLGSDTRLNAVYVHPQTAASNLWTVTHNLNTPLVDVLVQDSGGNFIEGDVTFLNNNSLTISFVPVFGGTAYIQRLPL